MCTFGTSLKSSLNFFSKVKAKKIAEPKLRAADPELVSFFNINTPEDLAASEKMSMEGRGIATTSNED